MGGFVGPGMKIKLLYISIKAAARKEVPQSEKLLSPLIKMNILRLRGVR